MFHLIQRFPLYRLMSTRAFPQNLVALVDTPKESGASLFPSSAQSDAAQLDLLSRGYLSHCWRLSNPSPSPSKDKSLLILPPPSYPSSSSSPSSIISEDPEVVFPQRIALIEPRPFLTEDGDAQQQGQEDAPHCALARRRELSRRAAALGVKLLKQGGASSFSLEPLGDAQGAAEGASLALYAYPGKRCTAPASLLPPPSMLKHIRDISLDLKQENDNEKEQEKEEEKEKEKEKGIVSMSLPESVGEEEAAQHRAAWERGAVLAAAQNWARTLADAPANVLPPSAFCGVVSEALRGAPGVTVVVRDEAWLAQRGMGGVLGVAQGSLLPPRFLEIHYHGVTFDAGGISIKGAGGMEAMKADMMGAAVVAAALRGAAALRLPLHVVGLMPLAENLPSGSAVKPGDVLTLHSGDTVEVLNTDAEGRLLLADALSYALSDAFLNQLPLLLDQSKINLNSSSSSTSSLSTSTTIQPRALIDIATLTGAMGVALGDAYAGVFCSSGALWRGLREAGALAGERFWRMPLDRTYRDAMRGDAVSDLRNIPKPARGGGACTAAAFLQHFAGGCPRWAHIDVAGVMESAGSVPYEPKGMSGKPVRALLEYAIALSQE